MMTYFFTKLTAALFGLGKGVGAGLTGVFKIGGASFSALILKFIGLPILIVLSGLCLFMFISDPHKSIDRVQGAMNAGSSGASGLATGLSATTNWLSDQTSWLLYGVSGEEKTVRSLSFLKKEALKEPTWGQTIWDTLFYIPRKFFGTMSEPLENRPVPLKLDVIADVHFLLNQDRQENNVIGRLRKIIGNVFDKTLKPETSGDLEKSNISPEGVDRLLSVLGKDSWIYVTAKQRPFIAEQIEDLRELGERYGDLVLSADRSAGFVVYGVIFVFILPLCLRFLRFLRDVFMSWLRNKYPAFYYSLPGNVAYYYALPSKVSTPETEEWLDRKVATLRRLLPTLGKGLVLWNLTSCLATCFQIERTRVHLIEGLQKICCSILDYKSEYVLALDGPNNLTAVWEKIHQEATYTSCFKDVLIHHGGITSILAIVVTAAAIAGGIYLVYLVVSSLPELGAAAASTAAANAASGGAGNSAAGSRGHSVDSAATAGNTSGGGLASQGQSVAAGWSMVHTDSPSATPVSPGAAASESAASLSGNRYKGYLDGGPSVAQRIAEQQVANAQTQTIGPPASRIRGLTPSGTRPALGMESANRSTAANSTPIPSPLDGIES